MWCDGCVRAERRAFAMNPTCPGLSHIQHSSYDLDETGKKGRKVGGHIDIGSLNYTKSKEEEIKKVKM